MVHKFYVQKVIIGICISVFAIGCTSNFGPAVQESTNTQSSTDENEGETATPGTGGGGSTPSTPSNPNPTPTNPTPTNPTPTTPTPTTPTTPTPTTPTPTEPTTPTVTRAFTGVRMYGPKAPWNVPVAGLPLHAESAKYAEYMFNDFGGTMPEMNFRKYTYPVYDASKATDSYVVKDTNNWGNLNGKTIPFNPAWKQNAGTDAQIIIVDPVSGKEWNLWEVVIDSSAKQITIGNGNLCPGDVFTNNWDTKATKCTGSRGVGINYLAMLVRPWEMEQGKIEHALSMPIIGTSGASYVAPATKLEHPGKVGNIPEGMRFALKITYEEIDAHVATLTGLTAAKKKAVKTILVALKDYGWFVTDTAGGHAFQFEAPESAQSEWERIGVLPDQNFGGVGYPRFMMSKFLTKDRIITIAPSDQYPK
jgi:Predicted solute binding protein